MKKRRIVRTLSHSFYDLKYHIVWKPKFRGKIFRTEKIKGEVRRMIETVCKWKKWEILELNIQEDHIHTVLLISPRFSISYVMQVLKGKTSAWMKKKIKRENGIYERQSLWARGYFASTIGMDEMIIRRYVKHQDIHNQTDQLSLFDKLN